MHIVCGSRNMGDLLGYSRKRPQRRRFDKDRQQTSREQVLWAIQPSPAPARRLEPFSALSVPHTEAPNQFHIPPHQISPFTSSHPIPNLLETTPSRQLHPGEQKPQPFQRYPWYEISRPSLPPLTTHLHTNQKLILTLPHRLLQHE